MTNEILFEENDIAQLEKKDRFNRLFRGTIFLAIEVIIVGILIRFFGLLILPLYLIFTWRYLTRPIPIAPHAYKITREGVMFGEKNILWLNKIIVVKHNGKKEYVSLNRNFGFEMIRLYSTKSSDLYNILNNLISARTPNIQKC